MQSIVVHKEALIYVYQKIYILYYILYNCIFTFYILIFFIYFIYILYFNSAERLHYILNSIKSLKSSKPIHLQKQNYYILPPFEQQSPFISSETTETFNTRTTDE